MKQKLFYWGAVFFALLATVLSFVFCDWEIAACACACYFIVPVLMIGSYELNPAFVFLHSVGILLSAVLLITNCHILWVILPLFILPLCYATKDITGRTVILILMQIALSFFMLLYARTHEISKTMDKTPYSEYTISSVKRISQTHSLVKFEESDADYHIVNSKAELLKDGDKVQVKTLDDNVWEIKRI